MKKVALLLAFMMILNIFPVFNLTAKAETLSAEDQYTLEDDSPAETPPEQSSLGEPCTCDDCAATNLGLPSDTDGYSEYMLINRDTAGLYCPEDIPEPNIVTYSLATDGDIQLTKNFKVREFRCNDGSDTIKIDLNLVDKLQIIRDFFGEPIGIVSGYRTESYNDKIGGSDESKHLLGQAADFYVNNIPNEKVASLAELLGLRGIEVYSDNGTGLHVDTRTTNIWYTYYSHNTKTYTDATKSADGRYFTALPADSLTSENPSCDHINISNGICPDCGYEWDYSETLDDSYEATYKTAEANVKLRSGPYQVKPIQKLIPSIGTKVHVLGLVENWVSYNTHNKWYKVTYNGITGYIYEERLEYDSPLESDISFSNIRGPTANWQPGKPCHLHGIVQSSRSMTRLWAYIENVDTGKIIYRTVSFSGKEYNVYNSVLDKNLKIGDLPVGNYRYYLKAEDITGYQETSSPYAFNIGNNIDCTTPTIKTEDYVGGKKITVSCPTAGATITYRIGNETGTTTGTISREVTETVDVEATARKDGVSSGTIKSTVYVHTVEPPQITAEPTVNGKRIFISAVASTLIYYSLDDGALQRYESPFEVTGNTTITAYAKRNGWADSAYTTIDIDVGPPAAPVLNNVSGASKIAQGDPITVTWDDISNAIGYDITVLLNGTAFAQERVVGGNSLTLQTDTVGTYAFTASSYNNIGSSVVSNTISVEAMPPSTVSFVDYDDTVLSEQIIGYGQDAVRPVAPTRRGYSFDGWSTSFDNVISDKLVRAEYTINSYQVRFLHYNGDLIGGVQTVQYKNAAVKPADPIYPVDGFEFIDWRLVEGEGDYTSVESDLTYEAAFRWGQENLPVVTEIVSAVRSETNADRYIININLNNYLEETAKGKILVNLKTAEGKMVATAMEYVSFDGAEPPPEGQPAQPEIISREIEVLYSGVASVAEIVLVRVDENDKTGGAFAQAVSSSISSGSLWSEWSYE